MVPSLEILKEGVDAGVVVALAIAIRARESSINCVLADVTFAGDVIPRLEDLGLR